MVQEADGTRRYLHRDGKGSIIAATSSNNSVYAKFTADVWGYGADEATSPYRFTARRMDEETGNYYYRNRYYHTDSGRFMSNDPIGYGDGLNMYAYVSNDPVNYRDPFGLSSEDDDEEGPGEEPELTPVGGGGSFAPPPVIVCPPGTTASGYSGGVLICTDTRDYGGTGGTSYGGGGFLGGGSGAPSGGVGGGSDGGGAGSPGESDEEFVKRAFCSLRPNGKSIPTDEIKANIGEAQKHDGPTDYLWFYNQVKTGGPWDYKNLPGNKPEEWEDFGNYHFGIVGRANGFTRTSLVLGAGLYQIKSGTSSWDYASSYFDDPQDTRMITLGMDQFDAGCFEDKTP